MENIPADYWLILCISLTDLVCMFPGSAPCGGHFPNRFPIPFSFSVTDGFSSRQHLPFLFNKIFTNRPSQQILFYSEVSFYQPPFLEFLIFELTGSSFSQKYVLLVCGNLCRINGLSQSGIQAAQLNRKSIRMINYLPDYTWEDIVGFSDEEMAYYKEFIENNAHLIIEFAKVV